MQKKEYICQCGRQFTNSYGLGNHKRSCKIYNMITYGNLDKIDFYHNKIKQRKQANNSKIEQNSINLQQWILEKHQCEYCKKIMTNYYGSGRFCSTQCARSFSTSKNRKEINIKVSQAFKKKRNNIPISTKYCKICNKQLKYNNKSGYCKECLWHAPELSEYRSKKGKNASEHIKNHKYWMPRNQTSYAEKFWIKVLTNNNIDYKHDYTIYIDSKHWYFLDFYIEKNGKYIDLEIDGKQHTYEDRKQHDIRRDIYLKSKGYLIYRIPWNEINSEKGKLLMKSKIDKFLDFYNNI